MILATVFFLSQAFACCYANARIVGALAARFAEPAAHACCAKAAPRAAAGAHGCAKSCCIQEAGKHAPQLASVPAELPALLPTIAFLALPAAAPIAPASRSAPVPDTGPPVYLRTLRILV